MQYFFCGDLLGFSSIVRNCKDEELWRRVESWNELVKSAAEQHGIDRVQLLSDTVFAAAGPESFESLLSFARTLLERGIANSLPLRGAITYGNFVWGTPIYGRAVVEAHTLESDQEWIGISLHASIEPNPQLFRSKDIILYPPPSKSSLFQIRPVLNWAVPRHRTLFQGLTGGGLCADKNPIPQSLIQKAHNTLIFYYYRTLLDQVGADYGQFYGFTPFELIEHRIFNERIAWVPPGGSLPQA